ncbi:MAG: hypothetical protein K0Q79_2461 [Flavipsychrobacter sp.]|jgi:hypothetical protein|nr:hypothetical protein [Flavipsychrobacter sp.]
MKSIKFILLGVVVGLCIVCTGLYSSCRKDVCKAVNCINGGQCGGGSCFCPNGVGGLNCEIIYRKLYEHVYKGSGADDSGRLYSNNTLSFVSNNDTSYTKMQVLWNNHGPKLINMEIILTSNTSQGSTFTVTSTPVDSSVFTGFGSVNNVSASLTLSEFRTTDSSVRSIQLHSFTKQ